MRILVNGNQVASLGEGAFFGEQALLKAVPRNADVVAKGKCVVLKLGKRSFCMFRRKLEDSLEMACVWVGLVPALSCFCGADLA